MKKDLSIPKLLILFLFAVSAVFAQENPTEVIRAYLLQHHQEMNLQTSDVASFVITDNVYSKHNQISHVHIAQRINGLILKNGVANFTINTKNEVLAVGNRLVNNVEGQITGSANPNLTPEKAILEAAKYVRMEGSFGAQIGDIENNRITFEKGTLSKENITVTLAYWKAGEGIELVWIVSLYQRDGKHWWQVYVNAVSGEVIETGDWVQSCDFSIAETTQAQKSITTKSAQSFQKTAMAGQGSYNVFALPVESPNHGSRSIRTSPADTVSSPFGWHDVNGISGAEYTTTRGNNVFAYTDVTDNNLPDFVPNGGTNLNFNFPLNLSQNPSGYQNVAVTNLFFTCNRIHDIFYHYGFDEANGNFQENNYGNGGAGSDFVLAEAQDGGGTNNANFGTPDDGFSGRMQMYIWTTSNAGANLLTINSPATIAGPYIAAESSFGPGLSFTPITANVVLANDGVGDVTDACQTIINGAALSGKIALVKRGSCNYTVKVQNAQNAGALAVIIINNVAGLVSPGGTSSAITIPSVMISLQDGNDIIAQLTAGNAVNATLVADSAVGFDRDGDLDNGIIVHEYGHGISTRIAGGPMNSGCLFNAEQMGEGWSDYFATMLTMDTSIVNPVNRPMGSYASGEPPYGSTGIRNAPYDTNFAVNNYTYGDVANVSLVSEPHGIGFVWATMLWDLTWDLIDVYGFDANIDSGNGGNNIALQLVLDGIALQPCSPGFVDGRDAILLADQLNNGGANQCLIWKAFAKRGLGFSASQGSSSSRSDQLEAFDLPNLCLVPITNPTANFSANTTFTCSGNVQFADSSTNLPQTWLWNFGDGTTSSLQNPFHTYNASGVYSVQLKVTNTLGADSILKTNYISITSPIAPSVVDGSGCSQDSIMLSATGTSTIGWFDSANKLVATGNTFKTPPSTSSTTFYARDGIVHPSSFVGPVDNSFGGGGYHGNASPFVINFTALDEITIHSAWVNSGSAGPRTVTLWSEPNAGGFVVQTVTVDVPFTGAGRVDLEIEVPFAGQYSFGLAQADLYRNNSGASYPYTLPGLMEITGSNATPVGGNDVFYYYFYNLEVSKTTCWGDSAAVTASITDTVDFSWTFNGFTVNFTDLSPNATTWAWDFGDGNSSTLQNPSHTYAQAGNYTVTLSVGGVACLATYKVNVGSFGLNEGNANSFGLKLYPNPAKTELHIDFSTALEKEGIVTLYTLQGQLVRQMHVEAGEKSAMLLLNGVAANVYMLQVDIAEGQFYEKVLIAK